jgi:pyrroloquinoline quinone biosynthesis protein B
MGCADSCCADLFVNPDPRRMVVSLGLIDHSAQKTYLFDASPDLSRQAHLLNNACSWSAERAPDRIFLTHAHIGHYAGLMYLGKEALYSSNVPVYAMPRMKKFLRENGPWSQLVAFENIALFDLEAESAIEFESGIRITPFLVPHRDEYSETVGFKIQGPQKTVLFIPDIDKWNLWDKDIRKEIEACDLVFIDGTFFNGDEIGYRDMQEVPHPSIEESMHLFKSLDPSERKKVHFIHFNHTNPVIREESPERELVLENGFQIAQFLDQFEL